jgi:hypothetical protein
MLDHGDSNMIEVKLARCDAPVHDPEKLTDFSDKIMRKLKQSKLTQ